MQLSQVNLSAGERTSFGEDGQKLVDNSEFILTYITKEIRKIHFITDGSFQFISIEPTFGEEKIYFDLHPYKVFCAQVPITHSEWENYLLSTPDHLISRFEFYLSLLERGYKIISKHKDIPEKELLAIHDRFRALGYKYEGTFKKIRLKKEGLIVCLKWYFTTFDFRLYAEVYDWKQTTMLMRELLLRTFPASLCFHHMFRSTEVTEELIIIKKSLGEIFLTIEREPLTRGIIRVRYYEYSKEDPLDIDGINRITW